MLIIAMHPIQHGIQISPDFARPRRGVGLLAPDHIQRLKALARPPVLRLQRQAPQVRQLLAPLGCLRSYHRLLFLPRLGTCCLPSREIIPSCPEIRNLYGTSVKIIGKLAKENGLDFLLPGQSADFNDETRLGRGKEMQDRLSKLVAIFDALDFRANRAEGDDLLGDAYEYLMRHFATESGKSKGQFYTPAEVSRIMAKVVGIGPDTRQDQTIYDPTCGAPRSTV